MFSKFTFFQGRYEIEKQTFYKPLEQSILRRDGDGLGAVFCAEFLKDRRQMKLDCPLRDAEPIR